MQTACVATVPSEIAKEISLYSSVYMIRPVGFERNHMTDESHTPHIPGFSGDIIMMEELDYSPFVILPDSFVHPQYVLQFVEYVKMLQ